MILFYLVRILIPAIFVLPVFLLVRLLWHFARQKPRGIKPNWYHEIGFFLFAAFLFGLANITISINPEFLFKPLPRGSINAVPFSTIGPMLNQMFKGGMHSFTNIVGNILMFAPIGFFIPLLWQKRRPLLSSTLWAMAASCFIEFTQLFSFRATDVDDVILNTLGGLIGGLLYLLLKKLWPRFTARFKIASKTDAKIALMQEE